jgi:hypothetical protein
VPGPPGPKPPLGAALVLNSKQAVLIRAEEGDACAAGHQHLSTKARSMKHEACFKLPLGFARPMIAPPPPRGGLLLHFFASFMAHGWCSLSCFFAGFTRAAFGAGLLATASPLSPPFASPAFAPPPPSSMSLTVLCRLTRPARFIVHILLDVLEGCV